MLNRAQSRESRADVKGFWCESGLAEWCQGTWHPAVLQTIPQPLGWQEQAEGSTVQAEGPVSKSHPAREQAPSGERVEQVRSSFRREAVLVLTSIVGSGWERDPTSSWPPLIAAVCLTVPKLLNIPPVKSVTQLPGFPETRGHGKASALGH